MPNIKYTLHRRQFYIGSEARLVDESWTSQPLQNGLVLSWSPALPVQFLEDSCKNRYVLLGDAVQSLDTEPSPEAALKNLKDIDSLPQVYRSWAGRWLLIANHEVHLDATAMLGCFYKKGPAGLELASAAGYLSGSFVPDTFGLVKNVGADYYPPPDSGFKAVNKLLPTQILNLQTCEIRFRNLQYEVPEMTYDETIAFAARLLKTKLTNAYAANKHKKWVLTLTAGNDSRILLATLLACNIPFEIITFHYPTINPFDVSIPRTLAKMTGKKHTLIKRRKKVRENWDKYNEHTCGHSVENDRDYMAYQQFDQLEGDNTYLLRGNCFEISRCYYYKWFPAQILNGADISTIVKGNQAQGQSWQKWVDWVRQTPQVSMDWRERLFIEQRLAGWHASTEQALDMINIERLVPANSFLYYNIFLKLPEAVRTTRKPVTDLIEKLAPQLLQLPFNPPLGYLYKQYRRVLFKVQKWKQKLAPAAPLLLLNAISCKCQRELLVSEWAEAACLPIMA